MSNPDSIHGRLAALFLATCLSACGGGGGSDSPPPPPPPPPAAAALAKSAGDAQAAAPGTAEAVAPDVLVTDLGGRPVAGATVTFATAAGSGSVAQATATTDANGHASCGSWTLGTTVGSNFLTATVAGAGTVTFLATAQRSAPDITFDDFHTPKLGGIAVDDAFGTRYVVDNAFHAFTSFRSTYSLQSATVTIGGITTPLAPDSFPASFDSYYSGLGAMVDLSSLARGPVDVVYTLTDALGHVADLVVPGIIDGKAVLTVSTPTYRQVVGTSFVVQGTCTDDNGPCGAWSISLRGGATLATGSGDTVSATVDLSAYDGSEVDLELHALDSVGQASTLPFSVIVNGSGHLRAVGSSTGTAKDLLGSRLLHVSSVTSVGFTLTVTDTDLGVDVAQVVQPVGYFSTAVLHTGGFVYSYIDSAFQEFLVDVHGSTATPVARMGLHSPTVAGDLVLYFDADAGELRTRDLVTGTTTTITTEAAVGGIAANGDVVFIGANGGIFRWRAGVVTQLPTAAPGTLQSPRTDGSVVVYTGSAGTTWTCYANDGTHETVLSSMTQGRVGYCQVAGDVVAYTKPDLLGAPQVWRHDGTGDVQLTVFADGAGLDAVAPDGTVLLGAGGGERFAVRGQPLGDVVGQALSQFTYRDGRFVEFVGGSALELVP